MTQSKASLGAIDEIELDFIGCSINNWATVFNSPEANEIVTVKCHHCETMIECRQIVAPFVACDPCIERVNHADKMKRYREFWERVCPEAYRETDTKHKDFPLAVWTEVKAKDKETPGQSYFLLGATGAGKTRVAFLLLKRAMLRGEHIGVLWPEKLATLKSGFDTAVFDRYAAYDTLLLDDTLLAACREPKLVESVKQLCDVRMRNKRPMILTSQINEEGLKSGKEYGDLKDADLERIAALMRRLRESCQVISFAQAVPVPGESLPF